MKENFKNDYLSSIKRDGIDKLIEWLDKSDFYEAPSSSKFHGNYKGGLCEHCILVYHLLKDKCDYWKNKKPDLFIPDDESLKIIALFHDLCKVNFYTEGFRNVKENNTWIKKPTYEIDDKFPAGHGSKSVIILQNFMTLKQCEILAIIHHMGIPDNYSDSQAFHKALKLYPFIILVHTSDFESSAILEKTIK